MTAPTVDATAFVHELAAVIGNVTLGPRVSVWPFAVLRGDSDAIVIGADSNVQDAAIIHVDPGVPVHIGERVAIGHRAIIHGATVESDALIAMGATLLNHVRVGAGSLIGAGAVCTEGMEIPPGSLVLGVPGRIVGEVKPEMRDRMRRTVESYLRLQERHRAGELERYRGPGSERQGGGG